MTKRGGYVMVEMLLSLSIAIMLFSLMVPTLSGLQRLNFDSVALQNRLGIIQLRNYLLLAANFDINDEGLSYNYEDELYNLRVVNDRLVQQPGTLIFLLEITEVDFYWEDEWLFMTYNYRDSFYTEILAYEE